MDIQTSLIYVAIVIVCAVVLFAISMIGIKEKTYEEAIAEQRQMPSENLLLGRSKDKNKDKKQKKAAGKKVKEKPAEKKRDSATEPATAHHENHHVEFEPEAEVIEEHPHQDDKKKKKKMKPILVNKAEHNVIVANAPVLANHFEESMPKDDLMLRRQSSREDIMVKVTQGTKGNAKTEKPSAPKATNKAEKNNAAVKIESVASKNEKNAQIKLEKAAEKIAKVAKPEVTVKVEKVSAPKAEKPAAKEKKVEKIVAPVVEDVIVAAVQEQEKAAPFVPSVVAKEQKNRKKKSDLVALQQMTEGVNVSLIVPLVQKAELSRTEIQNLIDLLLNKQQGSAVTNAEWIEGRQDPMVKLRKQLSEKEKALTDEQEAAQAVQSKLKELRAELNAERSRWRQADEAAAARKTELAAANARLQHEQEARSQEVTGLSKSLHEMQEKVSEDRALIRKLQKEQSQQQGAMQQDYINKCAQLEMQIARGQETVGGLEAEVNALRNQLREAEEVVARINHDLNVAQDGLREREAERKLFQDKISHLNSDLIRQEGIANGLDRKIEELNQVRSGLEHRILAGSRVESQLGFEKEQLLAELDAVKASLSAAGEAQGDVGRLQKEKDSLAAMVSELKASAQHAKDEKERLTSQLTGAEGSCRQLREEIESLAAQLTAVTERPAADGRENGDAHPEEASKEDTSLLKQKQVELATEINHYKTEISNLNSDLEAQRQKNNELRTRNWKAMDALSTTEKSLETQLKESKKLVNESTAAARLEEQQSARGLLERLFPEVSVRREAHAAWLADFESAAGQLLAKLRAPPPPVITAAADPAEAQRVAALENEVAQLHGRVATYKQIIQDTETLLNQLQTKTEETEAMWRTKHVEQGRDLEAAREEHDRLRAALEEASGTHEASSDSEMQSKLRELEEKVHSEEVEKHELTVRLEEMRTQLESNGDGSQSDLAANIQQLAEERERLQAELTGAEDKCREMAKEMVKLRGLVQVGEDSLSQEHRRTETLQHQVDKFNGVNDNHSVSTNGAETETSLSESFSVSSELLTDTERKPTKSRGKKKKAGLGKK